MRASITDNNKNRNNMENNNGNNTENTNGKNQENNRGHSQIFLFGGMQLVKTFAAIV
jgi:hypothetical protein